MVAASQRRGVGGRSKPGEGSSAIAEDADQPELIVGNIEMHYLLFEVAGEEGGVGARADVGVGGGGEVEEEEVGLVELQVVREGTAVHRELVDVRGVLAGGLCAHRNHAVRVAIRHPRAFYRIAGRRADQQRPHCQS